MGNLAFPQERQYTENNPSLLDCWRLGGFAKGKCTGAQEFWAPEERKKKKLRRTRPAQRESALRRSRRKPGKAV